MNTTELNNTRVQLYKATPLKLQLVEKVKNTLTHVFPQNGVETNGVRLDSNQLKIGELYVQMIEVDPQEIGSILVHWQPNYNISTKSDPYCSIYILTEKEIKDIWRFLKKIQCYYIKHSQYH